MRTRIGPARKDIAQPQERLEFRQSCSFHVCIWPKALVSKFCCALREPRGHGDQRIQ